MEIKTFPTIVPWDEPVEGARLLDEIADFIRQYMALPDHAAEILALFVAHTYLLDAAWFTPYILVTSPVPECGKTTLLDLLEPLVHQGQSTDGITAGGLYHRIARLQPTMLLDELDTRLHGPGAQALRGVLNSGYRRKGKLTISAGPKQGDRDFAVFCPKVLAGIGKVWPTVASRSIPIRLQRASPNELARLTKLDGHRIAAICLPFCRKLRRFADDTLAVLRQTEPVTPRELGGRAGDAWRPLLAIARVTGARWSVTARAAALATHGKPRDESDASERLLEDLRSLFADKGNPPALHTQTIVQTLVAREDRPWSGYGKTGVLTPRDVASMLDDFDVKSTTLRVAGVLGKGYRLADLRPVFERWVCAGAAGVKIVVA
jgi:hypothetical protein